MTDWLPLARLLTEGREADFPVSCHAGNIYSFQDFIGAVKHWFEKLKSQTDQNFALYCRDSYPFAVLLLALWYAGKTVWLPANNCPGTIEQLPQGCQLLGDWEFSFDYELANNQPNISLPPLPSHDTQLVIFTSGSTGSAKPIIKHLNQLQNELDNLEQCWGEQLGDASALTTVSHQHIYGLLFAVLWPLAAGRCFHSRRYQEPENILTFAGQQEAYWVASPAQLKRIVQDDFWQKSACLTMIFSSGGSLPLAAAQQIFNHSRQAVMEIYGSSETGGIAWRTLDQPWTLFPGLSLKSENGHNILYSPYLPSAEGMALADQLELLEDGRFLLLGRMDRIEKIEEKRLSLSEVEKHLLELPWISEGYAFTATTHRDVVAIAVVLSGEGLELQARNGRNYLIQKLRAGLSNWFEAIVLPRKWLFADALPLTPQGKIDTKLLKALLFNDHKKLPKLLSVKHDSNSIQLELKVSEELLYFADHFTSYPILPGVVQLAWAEHFGKLFFHILLPFHHLEVIKFMQVVVPGDILILSLSWIASKGKLYFQFDSAQGPRSSGRFVYGNEE